MNAEDVKRFQSVTPLTELVDIRPLEMSAQVVAKPPSPGMPVDLELKTGVRLERRSPENFAVSARFSVAARTADDEPREFARLNYAAVAVYNLNEGDTVEDERLLPFARHNGMIHLWPYFRAFVQNACAQLMIPPIVIPVFRVGVVEPADESTTSEGD